MSRAQKRLPRFWRIVFICGGFLFVGLAILGVFLPLLPTTGPAILASICFAKVNPKFYARLLNSKTLGPYLHNYYNKGGLTMPYKLRTVSFMWAGMVFSISIIGSVWVIVLLCIIGLGVSVHVFCIRAKKSGDKDHYSIKYSLGTSLLVWLWMGLAMAFGNAYWRLPLVGIFLAISAISFVGYLVVLRRGVAHHSDELS